MNLRMFADTRTTNDKEKAIRSYVELGARHVYIWVTTPKLKKKCMIIVIEKEVY